MGPWQKMGYRKVRRGVTMIFERTEFADAMLRELLCWQFGDIRYGYFDNAKCGR